MVRNRTLIRGAITLAVMGLTAGALAISPVGAAAPLTKAIVKKIAKKKATQVFNAKIGPAIANKQDKCTDGSVLAYARIDQSLLNPAAFSTSGVTGFNCAGGAIEAQYITTGEYRVRIPGITTPSADGVVADVTSGNWNDDTSPEDNLLSYAADAQSDFIEIEQHDAAGTPENDDFVIGVFAS